MEKITLELLYDHTLNFAMYNNDVSLIKKFKITNNCDEIIQNLDITLTFWPDFATAWNKKIEEIAPQTTIDLGLIDLKINPEYLFSLTERMKGQIIIEVVTNFNGEVEKLANNTFDVQLLAFDEWNGNLSIPEIITAFIIPNSPVISNILKNAAQYMEKWTSNSALNAYQSNNPNRVKQQMAAIYQALSDFGIDYVSPPASFEDRGQKIRLPQEIETYKIGTCLDLALLYASVLEAAKLNSIIVFIEGHAFVGCWLINECFPEGAFADYSLLSKRVADGINEICLVECTAFAGKQQVNFDEAVKAAELHMNDTSKFHYFVDVKRARISQIRPLPLRHQYTSYDSYVEDKDNLMGEVYNVDAPNQLNKIEFIDSNNPIAKTRIGNWQRQLLDLSLRNSLINFRNTANSITVLCPDLYTFEDSLSNGEEFQLFPIPAELANSVRDLEVYKKRTGNEFLSAITKSEFSQNRLRTLLKPSELSKTIVNIYRKARLAMEENGANVLYIGVGLLKWYENNSTDVARYAPLLLIPMEITKKSSSFGYVLRKREEETIFNVTLIQYIHSVFGKDLSGLEVMPQDDSGVDVRTLFAIVRKSIMDMPRWEIEESAVLSVFSFNKFVMWNDLKNRSDQLKKNRIVNSLINGEVDGSFTSEFDATNLDLEVNPAQIFTTTSADSSQLAAINAASKGASFVLHGPPGTGKSQTITNIISNLLGNGKTVLFVAEKMAALSVVQRRLEQLGLSPFCMELHSNKSNKKDILKKLEETLNLGLFKNSPDWETVTSELYSIKQELNNYVEALHYNHEIGFSLYNVLNRLSELKNIKANDFFTPETAFLYTREQFNKVQGFIRRLNVVGAGCGYPYKNPLQAIELDTFPSTMQGKLSSTIIETNFKINKLLSGNKNFKALFSLENNIDNIHFSELETLNKLNLLIKELPIIEKELACSLDFEKLKPQLTSAISISRNFFNQQAELYQSYNENIENININEFISEYNLANEKFFLLKVFALNKIIKNLLTYVKLGVKLDKNNLLTELQKIKSYIEIKNKYTQVSKDSGGYFGSRWGVLDNHDVLEKEIFSMEKLQAILSEIQSKDIRDSIRKNLYELLDKKSFGLSAFEELLTAVISNCINLFDMLSADKVKTQTISQLQKTITDWGNNQNNLQNYCQYNKVKKEAIELDVYNIIIAYENGDVENNDIFSAFSKAFYNAWSDKVIADNDYLSSFSRELEEDKITKFAELDNRYTVLVRQEVFQNLVERLPKAGQTSNPNSEVGMLIRAIHSGGRGMALRKLFDKIPNLLNRLAPCMLMSPISVAQYLDTNFPPFDVIIFDEASQMPTYEAIGAIARGKELIVVGDPKQLPPTSFFSNKPIEQDEEVVLQDLESILDDCLAINMPQKHLTWHYRSKHESLIAFSNYNFYEGKLLTFPSCDDTESNVSYVKVDGHYDRGETRQNKIEATAVVDEIVNQLNNYKGMSIGVVTFNQAQQILIEDMLDERISKDSNLEKQFSQQTAEPLFIKNLENVQGDERDIIIFSIGYGKDKNGYMSMNFGPINQNGGWRRLNVAISRARYKLIVYSSITGDDINLSKTNSAGVAYLKSFLDYAKNGVSTLTLATRPTDSSNNQFSAIENEIYDKLIATGYKVHRNVGTSRYKLPLAVLSKKTGKYIMGIEFDGAVFKNINSARDREILIKGVMEGLEWDVYRIWTQNWFSYSDNEFTRLVERLKHVEEQSLEDKVHVPTPIIKTVAFESSFISTTPKLESSNRNADVSIYEAVSLESINLPSETFYNAESTHMLIKQITEIITKESPVGFAAICRKIVNAWGMKRAGSRIEERLLSICDSLGLQKTNFKGLIYYWDKNTDINNYSGYRVSSGNAYRRDVEDIAPEEIINATKAVLEEQISLLENDLAKEVAKKFGYSRLAESTSSKFIIIFKYAVSEKKIFMDLNGKYTNL